MKKVFDLSGLAWTVTGFTPFVWRLGRSMELGQALKSELGPVPARVPGSVQAALLAAKQIPDWNRGLDARSIEWIENRHWVFQAKLPAGLLQRSPLDRTTLRANGLDKSGWVLVNGKQVGTFNNAFVKHTFDLTQALHDKANFLQIVFDTPPRWLGQIGYTSQIRDWKPRFNYGWDWTSRMVQIGIWDALMLETTSAPQLEDLRIQTDYTSAHNQGSLVLKGKISGKQKPGTKIRISLFNEKQRLIQKRFRPQQFLKGIALDNLPIQPWWPSGMGEQKLYTLRIELTDAHGKALDLACRTIGFKNISWHACQDAPQGADPWICAVNGKPLFLQGINWTPIRPNFADVLEKDYVQRLSTYQDMGCNVLRVWGGAYPEKQCFYDACDRMGLLLWQDLPLSSSGCDNVPPHDKKFINEFAEITRSYVERVGYHASLLLWCGGNELQWKRAVKGGAPLDRSHPLIARLESLLKKEDPLRRFVATSSSGPRFYAEEENFNKGLHWDVHGPWSLDKNFPKSWERYWSRDDSLFRSEVGVPGASPVAVIRTFAGDLPLLPGSVDNPLWRRTSWWIDWPFFIQEKKRKPRSLKEFVDWSQARQAAALGVAVGTCKGRFPKIGGVIIWMGHDSFPCTSNTALLDFYGKLKPAARVVAKLFKQPPGIS